MKLRFPLLLAMLVLGATVLAGCAQDSTTISNDNPQMQEDVAKEKSGESTDTTRSEASGGTDGTQLKLIADPDGALKYDTTKLNAEAGDITIALTNDSAVPHDVVVRDDSDKELGGSDEITKSSTDLVLKDVKAGTYTFFCSVPGHEQAGMKGTLTVR